MLSHQEIEYRTKRYDLLTAVLNSLTSLTQTNTARYTLLSIDTKQILKESLKSDPTLPVTSAQLTDQLYEAILLQRTHILDHNIHSKILSMPQGRIWVRYIDATQDKKSHPKLASFNYLRMFYSYLIAAITLSEIYHFRNDSFLQDIQLLREGVTRYFCNHYEKSNSEKLLTIIAEAKSHLIELIEIQTEKATKTCINSFLDKAKDWVSLEKTGIPIVTIIKMSKEFGDKTIIILDEPCTQLTAEQKKLFENVENQSWFLQLNDLQKNLILYYSPKLLLQGGKCVTPSPLRAYVPTSKNAYQQTFFIKDQNELLEFNTYFHSGTAAYLSHKTADITLPLTINNLRQQKLNSHTDHIVMICLNSKVGDYFVGPLEKYKGNKKYIPDDREIIELTERAADKLKADGIYFAKICLNGFRLIELNNYSGINTILAIIKKNVTLFERHSPLLPIDAKKNISDIIALLQKVKSTKSLLSIYDKDMHSLDMIYFLTRVASLNNQLIAKQFATNKNLQTVSVWFGCASGENRTGITYYNNICQGVIDYLAQQRKKSLSQAEKDTIYQLISDSQHIHVMTGNYGSGPFGKEGIRDKSSNSLKNCHPKQKLVTKAADLKSLPLLDADFNTALLRLKKTLCATPKRSLAAPLLPLAKTIYLQAEANRNRIPLLSEEQKLAYRKSLDAISDLLEKPHDKETFTNLCQTTAEVHKLENQTPLFKSQKTPSTLMICSGILIALIGVTLTTIALTSALASCGLTVPLIGGILALGTSLAIQTGAFTATASFFGLTFGGIGLAEHGLFRQRLGVGANLEKFTECSKKKTYRST